MWDKQPTTKEIAKSQERILKSSSRELSKDVNNLDRDMAKLEEEIRITVKKGDQAGARILARQLVKMREQRQRMSLVKAQVNSSSYTVKSVATQATMTRAIGETTANAMSVMNKQINVNAMQKIASTYNNESEKLEIKSEMMDDVYDSLFEGDEQEEAGIMNQMYDEIGFEYSYASPSTPSSKITNEHDKTKITDDQVDAFINAQTLLPNKE